MLDFHYYLGLLQPQEARDLYLYFTLEMRIDPQTAYKMAIHQYVLEETEENADEP